MEDLNGTQAWAKAYKFLRDQIAKGILRPGEKINERDVAEVTKVSRTPVREALRNLEGEGFLTNIPNKGVFVKRYSVEELDALYRMRIRLEGLAVEMAIPKLSKKDINDLKKINNRLKSLASRKRYIDYWTVNDAEFHLFFPGKAGSEELLSVISHLRKKTFRLQYAKILMLESAFRYVDDHDEIISALEGKINKNPVQCMESHIERARKAFLNFYKELWF